MLPALVFYSIVPCVTHLYCRKFMKLLSKRRWKQIQQAQA